MKHIKASTLKVGESFIDTMGRELIRVEHSNRHFFDRLYRDHVIGVDMEKHHLHFIHPTNSVSVPSNRK